MTAILHSKGVTKGFGAVIAADQVDISIEPGEVVGIIGANGAGKTTFVNMVTGYIKPDKGDIFFFDRNITALSPREITRLGLCRSFQIPQLFLGLSPLDNLLVALSIVQVTGRRLLEPARTESRVSKAAEILDFYGLADYGQQLTSTLPQGIRKLLDIALATVGAPKLVLLDEPTSGISADEKNAIMDTLIAVLRRQGITILFIEHDMDVVERYADRVAAFYEGRIIADGVPAKVLSDKDVRKFVVGTEIHRRQAKPKGRGRNAGR